MTGESIDVEKNEDVEVDSDDESRCTRKIERGCSKKSKEKNS